MQDIQRHLDRKQPSRSFHNDVRLKAYIDDNLAGNPLQNLTLVTESYDNVTTEVYKYDDVTTRRHFGHRHRHQHTTESLRNPVSVTRTKLHNVEDDEKHLTNNSIPDTCYCVPHSS